MLGPSYRDSKPASGCCPMSGGGHLRLTGRMLTEGARGCRPEKGSDERMLLAGVLAQKEGVGEARAVPSTPRRLSYY